MTVGNSARLQLGMAQAQTRYGSQLDGLYGKMMSGRLGKYSSSTQTLNDLLKSRALKNKDSDYRERFSELYKKIYGSDDESSDESVSTAQSVKSAAANAGGAAESIKDYANSLTYGGEVDVDAYRKQAQNFVDSYNEMVDKVGNSDNQSVLQKGVLTVNTTKVSRSALQRAGITLGTDNKLTVNDDLSKVKASDIKVTFGSKGYSDKIIQKARQINTLTGGSGSFTKGVSSVGSTSSAASSEKVDNAGTLKELTAAVKDAATAVKSYASGLGSEGKAFVATDYTKTAKDFVDKYNSFVDEMAKSDKSSVRNKGVTLQSSARAYKYSLERAGITVGKDGKLSLGDEARLNKLTAQDVKYSFGNGGFIDKVSEKADQVKSLVSSASAMGYNSDKTSNYAYTSGALYSVYA